MHRILCFLKTLGEILTHWRVPSASGDPRDAEVAIALSFGSEAMNLSNRALAKMAMDLQHQYHNLELILQYEVFCAGWGFRCYPICHPHHKYINTFDVLRVAATICEAQHWHKIALICHPDQYWRAERVAKKLGLEIAFVPDLSGVPYAPDDPQSWVRSGDDFRPRERVARLLFLCKGWI